jgi:predicted TIM-barrel fold metal-dependent hydrolase
MSSLSGAGIRARLAHPVIDSDGHVLEFVPAVRDEIEALAGREVAAAWDGVLGVWKRARAMSAAEKRAQGLFRMTWWGFPARNTEDRAMAMLPELMHARLPELGIDYAILYPTFGLGTLNIDADELRRASVRAFNRSAAAATQGLRDRLCPVAMIPMHTPEEAVAELEHCVRELGFRAVLLAGHVARPAPIPDPPRVARWIDTLGLDSLYDYDPVWAKCQELGVAPTFHSSAMGWSGRASPSNYVLNHLGNFAAAGEATCRSLFLGGVTRRFPRLRMAFLEGGVAWACQLYSDLVGHFEKRGAGRVHAYDPREIDRARMRELFARHAPPSFRRHADELDAVLHLLAEPDEDPAGLDEFARCAIERPEELRELFTEPFHFGCEADDPMNALAFDRARNPFGARLKAIWGSDIGHWDVPDCARVLHETVEQVERGLLDEDQLRDFVFANPVDLWTSGNPDFFRGTAIEDAVAKEVAGRLLGSEG